MNIWAAVTASAALSPCTPSIIFFPSCPGWGLHKTVEKLTGNLFWPFFFSPLGCFLFPDVAHHVAQQTATPVQERWWCRAVSRYGVGWHCHRTKGLSNCSLNDLTAIQCLKDCIVSCFFFFFFVCSSLNGHSNIQLKMKLQLSLIASVEVPSQHCSGASPRAPSVSYCWTTMWYYEYYFMIILQG